MPTDFAYAAFFVPVLICIGFLVAIGFIGKPAPLGDKAFLGLGRVRLARGYLGAILATFVCTAITATQLGFSKVSLGHISKAELPHLLPGYILYFFILSVPFVLAALTIIGLPALAALRKFNAMSIVMASICALLFSIALGILTVLMPFNDWCGSHMLQCGSESAFSTALIAIPVIAGFTLAARVPFRLSSNAA